MRTKLGPTTSENLRMACFTRLLSCLFLAAFSGPQFAADIVRLQGADPAKGPVPDFKMVVLDEALRRTEKDYGPFSYQYGTLVMTRERTLQELLLGTEQNLSIVATQPSWEAQLLTVRIPIDMGLSGLRVMLIHRDAEARLATIRRVDELKKLQMGVVESWATRQIAEAGGFTVAPAASYEAVLKMLLHGRSDYFPRSLGEAFLEFDVWRKTEPDLRVEQSLLLNLPLPTYVFVSPKAPRLAKRIEAGMASMVRDGTLRRLVLQHNADMLARARLCERRMLNIENPLLSPETPLKRKELWFDPRDPRNGLCKTAPR